MVETQLNVLPFLFDSVNISDKSIRKIEDTLVSSRAFTLPGKKKLQQPNYQLGVVVVDVTETPIERPKKNKNSSTAGKIKDIH